MPSLKETKSTKTRTAFCTAEVCTTLITAITRSKAFTTKKKKIAEVDAQCVEAGVQCAHGALIEIGSAILLSETLQKAFCASLLAFFTQHVFHEVHSYSSTTKGNELPMMMKRLGVGGKNETTYG